MTPQEKAAWESIEQGRFILLNVCPWFGPALLKIVPKPNDQIATCAMGTDAIMHFNPTTVTSWSPREMAGITLHEALHLWNKHHERAVGMDPTLANVAMDIAINEMVDGIPGLDLPGNPCRAANYGLPAGWTFERYYHALVEKAEAEQAKQAKSDGDDDGDDDDGDDDDGDDAGNDDGDDAGNGLANALARAGYPMPDPNNPTPGSGHCGEAAGNPVPGEPKSGTDGDGRDEEDVASGFRAAADAIENGGSEHGTLPAGLRVLAKSTLAPPKISWREKLRYAARTSCKWRPGSRRRGYREPSHLQWGVGYGRRRPILPVWYDTIPKVAVAIDTSASMNGGPLEEALRETRGIMKHLRASVRFIACDAAVHRDIEAKNLDDVVKNLSGGGGTDFRPVFTHLEESKDSRPDVLVFITDGFGIAPIKAPNWCKVIWVVTTGGGSPAPWGSLIKMGNV